MIQDTAEAAHPDVATGAGAGTDAAVAPGADVRRPGDALKLFSLGFLTLALELALIRYLAGSIWNLGYFPNLVLLAVFIGMGSGFVFHGRVTAARSPRVAQGAPWLLLLLSVLVTLLHPGMPGAGTWMHGVGGELYFTEIPQAGDSQGAVLFLLWFLSVLGVFACLSQRTAKLFRRFPPLSAYTLDIGGSCAGIIGFTLISLFQVPAWGWFLLLAPFFAVALSDEATGDGVAARLLPVAPLLLVSGLSYYQDTKLLSVPEYSGALEVHWSPYQKIELVPAKLAIFANGIAHQGMHPPKELRGSYYEEPYLQRAKRADLPRYKNVLIMGAGSGNDVMAALMNGVEHVDAVEIDPVIAGIGRRTHPGQPYADPRVTVHVDDARAFMTRTPRKYDLIIFALTDSLVKVSSMSQLRLENYLFTADSFKRAFQLLSDTGDIVMYNFYRTPWLAEKLRRSLAEAAGRAPELLLSHQDFKMLAAGRARPASALAPFYEGPLELPRDDWPFLYLRERGLPPLYLGIMAGLLLLIGGMMVVLRLSGPAAGAPVEGEAGWLMRVAFLLMGAAFLLLETKSVVQFSLLFGTTWLNNSLVFLAVLSLVLLANWSAVLLQGRWVVPVSYGLLLVACLMTLVYPLAKLLQIESGVLRFLSASLLTFSPIFFANLIFSVMFRDQPVAEQVFGWNLIGATLGGVIEYTSMALGYNALAVLVAVLYTVVFGLLLAAQRKNSVAGKEAAQAR